MEITLKLPFANKRDSGVPELGDENEQIALLGHGKYYALVKRGIVFSQAVTPLGIAIPLYTATAVAGSLPIWNPPNSGVNVVPLLFNTTRASGTAAFAAIGLMVRTEQIPQSTATAAEITAFNIVVPKNGIVGGGEATKVLSSNAGTTTIVAGVATEWHTTLAGMNIEADTGTNQGTFVTGPFDFDGSVVLPPGSLAWIAATKASVALFASSISWAEVPV